jgi:acetyl esterase/lipase
MIHRRCLLALLLLPVFGLMIAAPQAGLSQDKTQPKGSKLPAGTAEYRDLSYGSHKERNNLNLFVPKSDSPLPLVLWVHGGGWSAGSKEGDNPAMRLLEKGYAVASTNYRLSQHAVFPAQIEDVKSAVRFLRTNAKKYNLAPDQFGAWGASAGGHLVALLGTTGDDKEFDSDSKKDTSSKVQAVIDFFGPTDLLKLSPPNAKDNPITKLLGGNTGEKKELAVKANPITHITKDDPPFLIVQGDTDPLVPASQSELLAEALKKAGVECELVIIKGAGHGGTQFGTKEMQDKYLAFFDKNLKKKP